MKLRAAFFALLFCVPSMSFAREPLADQVKKSISDGIRYLRELEGGKGDFEHTTVVAKARPGGVTGLAVVALLQAGVPPDDPLIQRCLKYLRKEQPSQTYTVGLQTMAFCMAGFESDRELVRRNLKWLASARTTGGWGYDAVIKNPDHSINQYALLGIHEAWLAGFKIDPDLMRSMYDHYKGNKSGQWQYRNTGPSLTMTTAGLCNLIITGQDVAGLRALNAQGVDANCGDYGDEQTIKEALRYIGGNFPNNIEARANLQHPFYCLYGIERAGRLTGQRFLRDKDWYRIGCEYLVKNQNKDGGWEGATGRSLDSWPPIASSFALLFLSKGRTPVLISKLAHGEPDPRTQREPWNTKRSDMRHVVNYCSRELFEKTPLAWQVFDTRGIKPEVRGPSELAEDLLQSPIVYITGHSLNGVIGKRDEEMLKEFVTNGGFILGHDCCGGKCGDGRFDKNFRELIKNVTGSDLGPLGKDHAVWTAAGAKFTVAKKERFELEGVNLGCKTIVMYVPKSISGWWENNDYEGKDGGKDSFHLAANVVAYATGMELPKPRLTKMDIIKESEGKTPPRGHLQVAQLVGARDALPLAPRAIPNLMAELGKLDFEVHRAAKKLTLGTEDVLKFKFFYMHDNKGFAVPTAAELDNLRYSLEHDGLLLADAACGSKQFDKSFRELVERLWPKDKYPDRQLAALDLKANQEKDGLYSKEVNGTIIETVKYRREEEGGMPSKDFVEGEPKLEGVKINGRWAVIYSRYDIGCALEKQQSTGCLGYDHDSAKLLARAVVLYALRR